jgi:hypothetical protein
VSRLRAGLSEVRLLSETTDFSFLQKSITTLGNTQWVSGAACPGIKRPGREADHSPPSSDEVTHHSYTLLAYAGTTLPFTVIFT